MPSSTEGLFCFFYAFSAHILPNCGCKGTIFSPTGKIFRAFSLIFNMKNIVFTQL